MYLMHVCSIIKVLGEIFRAPLLFCCGLFLKIVSTFLKKSTGRLIGIIKEEPRRTCNFGLVLPDTENVSDE